MIRTYDKMGLFINRAQKKRLKDEIKRALNLPDFTYESEIIQELDEKVNESVKDIR